MKVVETGIKGLIILEPRIFGDDRGYFLESYNKKWFHEHIGAIDFIQDNESKSKRGVLRGLHFQVPPYDQAKLVRVIEGEVLDVAVDLRASSPTYGDFRSVLLNDKNKRQLFVPRGFAHGFIVLSDDAVFGYKVDNSYAPDHEDGIIWNDPDLGIDWHVGDEEVKLSDKDKKLPSFSNFESPFK